jgi:hypothetical protein
LQETLQKSTKVDAEYNLPVFREHSGNIQGTFREHSGSIQGTFRKHSGNIQGELSGRLWASIPTARSTFKSTKVDAEYNLPT